MRNIKHTHQYLYFHSHNTINLSPKFGRSTEKLVLDHYPGMFTFARLLAMPSVKYLQLILMNLTVAGLSSSEFGESSRRRDFADMHFEIPSCRKSEEKIRDLNVLLRF